MPFTLSHAAVAVPFLRSRKKGGGDAGDGLDKLNERNFLKEERRSLMILGLFVGSLSPDFGYYLNQYKLGTLGHSPMGTLTACLPLGVLVSMVLIGFGPAFARLFPTPHREFQMSWWKQTPFPNSLAALWMLGVGVVVGAWTHLIWDSFTHDTGWFVGIFPILAVTLWEIGGVQVELFRFLQHLSTLTGLVILGWTYRVHLEAFIAENETLSCRAEVSRVGFGRSLFRRWGFWLVALGLAFLIGAILNLPELVGGSDFRAVRRFAFKMAVLSMQTLMAIVVIGMVFVHLRRAGRE